MLTIINEELASHSKLVKKKCLAMLIPELQRWQKYIFQGRSFLSLVELKERNPNELPLLHCFCEKLETSMQLIMPLLQGELDYYLKEILLLLQLLI